MKNRMAVEKHAKLRIGPFRTALILKAMCQPVPHYLFPDLTTGASFHLRTWEIGPGNSF